MAVITIRLKSLARLLGYNPRNYFWENYSIVHGYALWYNISMNSKLDLRKQVTLLRRQGKTYSEIRQLAGAAIPKGTLSFWCKSVTLTAKQKNRIAKLQRSNIDKQREKALRVLRRKQQEHLQSIRKNAKQLSPVMKDSGVVKVCLALLYWCEGSGFRRSSVTFGNSNPGIISVFMQWLRDSYVIDEKKFRCTLQCRADQNIERLQRYWSRITQIPLRQFYTARVDPRTIGKPSSKRGYKGVCRVDYFSASIYHELKLIPEVLFTGR